MYPHQIILYLLISNKKVVFLTTKTQLHLSVDQKQKRQKNPIYITINNEINTIMF